MVMARILVIDDDHDFNQLLATYLSEQGHQVSVAYNGREGLARYEKDLPDVVLSDIRMPKKDGVDLLLKFRNHPDHQPKGIILMSGLGNTDNNRYKATLKTLGAYDFLQKPFPLEHLSAQITQILQGAESK
jgi:DNA-binding response OmpR family regulator